MEKYIQTVLEQIRCKKAHELIRQEMEVHLEEQICDYMEDGMTREEATEAAVKDMGDPVETGVELDRIHRPRMEWRILLFVIGISIVGLFMRYFIARECEIMGTYSWSHNLEVTILGVLLMSLFYKIDYTWIGLYAKKIGTVFCVLYLLVLLQARSINGVRAYVNLGVISFSTILLLYLFVPIYGGILFQYRGSGKAGLLKAIIWLAIPVVLALGVPNIGLAMAMGVVLSLLLSVAVWKGWFRVSKKRFLSMYWCMLLGLPFLLFGILQKVPIFQNPADMNLQFYLGNLPNGIYSVQNIITKIVSGSQWFGSGQLESLKALPSMLHTYVLTAIIAYYGIGIAFVLIGLLLFMSGKLFSVASRQKNQLGQMMGYGCGFVFLTWIFSAVVGNLGVTVWIYGDIPFLSASGSTTLIAYIFIGIVLSIYRYKNILPANPCKKKLRIKIEKV